MGVLKTAENPDAGHALNDFAEFVRIHSEGGVGQMTSSGKSIGSTPSDLNERIDELTARCDRLESVVADLVRQIGSSGNTANAAGIERFGNSSGVYDEPSKLRQP